MTLQRTTIFLASVLIAGMLSTGIGNAYACVMTDPPEPGSTPATVFDLGGGEFLVIVEATTFGGFTGDVCGAGLTFGSIVTMITDCVVVLTGSLDEVPGFENFIQNMTATNALDSAIPDGFAWQGFTNIVSEDVEPDLAVDLLFTVFAPGSTLEEVEAALSGGAIATGKTNSDGSEFIGHFTVTPVDTPIKVDICHKGKNTLNVSSNAIHAHLAHGDTLGSCSI